MRLKTVLVWGLPIFILYYLISDCSYLKWKQFGNTRGTRWTVVPFFDIRVKSTYSLHGEQGPMLLKSQEVQSQLRSANSPNAAQMAQSSVSAALRVAGTIAAAPPQWPSIKATANEDMHNIQDKSTSQIGPLTHGIQTLGHMMTIVIMGYSEDRKENYGSFLPEYRSMCGVVSKIIVVWNNDKVLPPIVPAAKNWTQCVVPVEIVRPNKNSMNNRFLVADLVQTEAVLSVDDDFLISKNMLHCLFRHWKKDKDRIVGHVARFAALSGAYLQAQPSGYNLILVGSAMFHVRFLSLYAKDLEVQAKVDSLMNGDDILFNAVTQNATGKPPLLVVASKNFDVHLFRKSSAVGLSSRSPWEVWVQERTEFILWAQKHFSKTVFQLETKNESCTS